MSSVEDRAPSEADGVLSGVVFDGTPDRLVLFQEFPLEIEISVETIPGIASDDPASVQREFALA
jgi:hypothetical protein